MPEPQLNAPVVLLIIIMSAAKYDIVLKDIDIMAFLPYLLSFEVKHVQHYVYHNSVFQCQLLTHCSWIIP